MPNKVIMERHGIRDMRMQGEHLQPPARQRRVCGFQDGAGCASLSDLHFGLVAMNAMPCDDLPIITQHPFRTCKPVGDRVRFFVPFWTRQEYRDRHGLVIEDDDRQRIANRRQRRCI